MSNVPKTYQQASSSPDSCKWQSAMEEEMQALRGKTIHLSLPPCLKAEKQWGFDGFTLLNKAQMGEERHKARFLAKGYSQVAEIDYHETFSPTANLTSIRILIQLAVNYNCTSTSTRTRTITITITIIIINK